MDPFAPIGGISLERYADLAADVAEISDPAEQVAVVGRKGVNAADWEAAMAGWTARMQDMSLQGQVASRFMPLYQAALARRSSTAHAVSGAMPGAMPVPTYDPRATPGYLPPMAPGPMAAPPHAPYPPQPYAQPYGARPPQQPQPQFNQQAAAFGNDVGNAFNAFGNALGSFVNGAVGGGVAVGAAVLVQWSDGKRYPGTVTMMQNGQVQVSFPDGRQVWVPQQYVTLRPAF